MSMMAYARSGQRDKAAELIEKEIAPRMPAQVPRVWQVWISETTGEISRLITDQKLEEALVIGEEVLRRAPADLTQPVAGQLGELRRVVGHNRFVKRYNEAVALLQQQKVAEAQTILQELVATTQEPADLEMARKLSGEVEEFLRAQGKGGKKKG